MDKNLLIKYYKHNCDLEETKVVECWILSNQESPVIKQMLQDVWQEVNKDKAFTDADFNQVFLSILGKLDYSEAKSPKREKVKSMFLPAGIAASITLVLLFFFLVFSNSLTHQKLTTNFSEVQQVTLPDGSKVKLNANSTLSYPKDFKENKVREVWLEGEAFFDVVHQEQHQKFIVHTTNLDVEVLGTSFNVKDRKKKTSIVLNTGKIKLNLPETIGSSQQILMNPGELVEFDQNSNQLLKKEVDTDVYTSWRKNLLIFNKTSLREIADLIEENFGKTVIFRQDSIASFAFTGSNPNDDLQLLLKTIARSFDLQVEEQEGEILLKPVGKHE